jgi:hypothetical protein
LTDRWGAVGTPNRAPLLGEAAACGPSPLEVLVAGAKPAIVSKINVRLASLHALLVKCVI